MIELRNQDCKEVIQKIDFPVQAVYADCIYESLDFSWADLCYEVLADTGLFYVQTDYHTMAEWKLYLDRLFGKENFINHLIYYNEWGGVSKRRFSRKHDDIFLYSKNSRLYKFYPDRIRIDKVTAGTKFDKRGLGKIPCDVFYDLGNFSTVSKERIKLSDGVSFKWQKPMKLINRLLLPVTDIGDVVLDPFCGVGTVPAWCTENQRDCIATEIDEELFQISIKRLGLDFS